MKGLFGGGGDLCFCTCNSSCTLSCWGFFVWLVFFFYQMVTVVACSVAPGSFPHAWLCCIKTETRLKSLEMQIILPVLNCFAFQFSSVQFLNYFFPLQTLQVNYFVLRNPSSFPVTLQLLPLSYYPDPQASLSLLNKW